MAPVHGTGAFMRCEIMLFYCFCLGFTSLLFVPMGYAKQIKSQPVFTFPEFYYKESSKNEMAFREYEAACELNQSCQNLKGVSHIKCVRECISPSCYHDIYRKDELEDGEIDVRLSSFKGCFIQRISRTRN